jgi:hypothetical protein
MVEVLLEMRHDHLCCRSPWMILYRNLCHVRLHAKMAEERARMWSFSLRIELMDGSGHPNRDSFAESVEHKY